MLGIVLCLLIGLFTHVRIVLYMIVLYVLYNTSFAGLSSLCHLPVETMPAVLQQVYFDSIFLLVTLLNLCTGLTNITMFQAMPNILLMLLDLMEPLEESETKEDDDGMSASDLIVRYLEV